MSDTLARRSFLGMGIGAGALLVLPACAQHRGVRLFDVRGFGARGDGVTDDAPAFQRAIDAAAAAGGGTVRFDRGVFVLRLRPARDGQAVEAITLRSGVSLEGTDRSGSVLRLADGQLGPGTFMRIVSSAGAVSDLALRNFTLDANRTGQGAFRDASNGGAIVIGVGGRADNVTVEKVNVRDANGQAIMLVGAFEQPGRNLRIADCLVERASYIGIQSSQFEGLVIEGNTVSDCHDNGIDIYGNNDVTHATVVTSHNALVRGNIVSRCSVGIFLETVADCQAVDNNISDCRTTGIRVNRINGEPRNLDIRNNRITGGPIGVAVGGDTGGVTFRGNTIAGFTDAGVQFGYNVSYVTVVDNQFTPARSTVPIILGKPIQLGRNPEEQLAFITISGNRVPRGHPPGRMFVNTYRRQWQVKAGGFQAILR